MNKKKLSVDEKVQKMKERIYRRNIKAQNIYSKRKKKIFDSDVYQNSKIYKNHEQYYNNYNIRRIIENAEYVMSVSIRYDKYMFDALDKEKSVVVIAKIEK
mgnify:CR=1 FL=1|jgi:hypothetical protein